MIRSVSVSRALLIQSFIKIYKCIITVRTCCELSTSPRCKFSGQRKFSLINAVIIVPSESGVSATYPLRIINVSFISQLLLQYALITSNHSQAKALKFPSTPWPPDIHPLQTSVKAAQPAPGSTPFPLGSFQGCSVAFE
jgi:hypothetical protein